MSATAVERRKNAERNRRLRIAAYVLLAFAGTYGFWRVENLANDVEQAAMERSEDRIREVELLADETKGRAKQICEETNKIRSVILELINRPSSTASIDLTTLDPEVADIIRRNREQAAQFRARASELLALQDCERLT